MGDVKRLKLNDILEAKFSSRIDKFTIIVSGPCGCGKTTLLRDLEKLGYKLELGEPMHGTVIATILSTPRAP